MKRVTSILTYMTGFVHKKSAAIAALNSFNSFNLFIYLSKLL